MPFAEDMLARLKPLALKLVELGMYGYLSDVADLLTGFESGNWPKMSDEEQEQYLKQMADTTFHPKAMGDSELSDDSNYRYVAERIAQEYTIVRRRLSG
jgi:hypothetical protein